MKRGFRNVPPEGLIEWTLIFPPMDWIPIPESESQITAAQVSNGIKSPSRTSTNEVKASSRIVGFTHK